MLEIIESDRPEYEDVPVYENEQQELEHVIICLLREANHGLCGSPSTATVSFRYLNVLENIMERRGYDQLQIRDYIPYKFPGKTMRRAV